jgi:diketogulonate reductase-like aldo/keto reductase
LITHKVQTKFTPAWAHLEGKIPYNTNQNLKDQVRESIEQSFKHLNVNFIDLFLLHVPFHDEKDNLVAWKVFEEYVPHRIGALGVSNIELPLFRSIYDAVTVKPQVVQNRFWREMGYDIDLREYLASKGVIYQAYHLLKANQEILSSDILASIAAKLNISKQLAFYMLVLGLGKVSILNGTTSEVHMTEDIMGMECILKDAEKLDVLKGFLPAFEALLFQLSQKESSIERDVF